MKLAKFTSGIFLAGNIAAQTQPPAITSFNSFDGGSSLSPAAYAFVSGSNFLTLLSECGNGRERA
jgi:hypothetical protein